MEVKKNPGADLTRKRGLFLSIGFVVSLLLVITAFEKKSYDDGPGMDLGSVVDDFEELTEIPPTEQPPPPPPPKVIQQPEVIEVPDEEEIEEEIEVNLDVEVNEETEVEEIVFEEAPVEEEAEEIFTIVEDQPEYPGGTAAFYKYVGKAMKYPPQARRMGIEGRVFVSFVVDKDGTISDVQVMRGIGAGADEEAVRVIKNSKKWNPGKQRGRPVKVKMVLPIIFKLN
ncbi:energy transducer TonB [Xanthovirga aplysinae]|uniref:energy transducer TonB n=1 Tax=Xanthovirga aplysinae TaxID=2529853 RepID=UPI0012BD12B0|nr:energy transducer TonB [Xanthovirga aplysinae]MTI30709.1 energy transducer TonB [Xanthovirga aplysinae]